MSREEPAAEAKATMSHEEILEVILDGACSLQKAIDSGCRHCVRKHAAHAQLKREMSALIEAGGRS